MKILIGIGRTLIRKENLAFLPYFFYKVNMKGDIVKEKITQEELKRNLHYNPEAGLFKWKISNNRRIKIGDIAGTKTHGYIIIRINKKNYYSHRLAWLYMEGYFPENDTDHIDRNKSNNSWDNLRHVSKSCNSRNCKISKNNKSGVTGVSWYKNYKKWHGQIMINKKIIKLGYYKNKDDAVLARWNAEVKYDYPNCNTTSSAYNYLKDKGLI